MYNFFETFKYNKYKYKHLYLNQRGGGVKFGIKKAEIKTLP